MPETLEFAYDVFISYSHRERDWVRGELLPRLERAGLRAFVDFRDFRPGAPTLTEMERGVATCRKTLLVLTPDYIQSGWCEIESVMSQTRDPANRALRLIPILKAGCDTPPRLDALTQIDFTEGADTDLAWRRLLIALDSAPAYRADEPVPPELQADLDNASACLEADRFAEAIPILERALARADEAGHGGARVKARVKLASALSEAREDFVGAERHLRHALVLVPCADLDLEHAVLYGLGGMLVLSRRLDEAKVAVGAGLRTARLTGKTGPLAMSLLLKGLLDRELGLLESSASAVDEALQLLRQQELALRDAERAAHANRIGFCYINKALLCREAGDLEAALAFGTKAEQQHRIAGDMLNAGKALLTTGELHCTNADWADGFACYEQALELFAAVPHPLWTARVMERLSMLFAAHKQWEEALVTIFGAVTSAEEAGHPGDQVHALAQAVALLRESRREVYREQAARGFYALAKEVPPDQLARAMTEVSETIAGFPEAIENTVRQDEQIRALFENAQRIAKDAQLLAQQADFLLDRAHHAADGDEQRRELITSAVALLRRALQEAQSPKQRGHLTGRIGALCLQLDDPAESLSWLNRARAIFEASGDVRGLARVHASLAELHCKERRLDEEIGAHRTVLVLTEGRSFHDLIAGTKINLAAALRYRGRRHEAATLLDEAEAICDRHKLDDMVDKIARLRSKIDVELRMTQVPTKTLSELLDSLGQLLHHKPEHAVGYLCFWYFAWQPELLALLRSGPGLSLMVVSDDVDRVLGFAGRFQHVADHFLLITSQPLKVKPESAILAIPPDWSFPADFPFLSLLRPAGSPTSARQEQGDNEAPDGPPSSVQLAGPARMLPRYVLMREPSSEAGERQVMSLSTAAVPQAAVDLMIRHPMDDLVAAQTVWLPTRRHVARDPFVSDLRQAHARGLVPVYFDRLPASEGVVARGGARLRLPGAFFTSDRPAPRTILRQALLALLSVTGDEAQAALLQLPERLGDGDGHQSNSLVVEIRLCEFVNIDRRVLHPVLLLPA